jgi:Rhabdovirus nucleocapsid protein
MSNWEQFLRLTGADGLGTVASNELFASNPTPPKPPKSKPLITLPRATKTIGDYQRTIAKLHMENKAVPLNLALAFLRLVMETKMQAQLDKDWSSFGQEIGKKGATINALSLVNVTTIEETIETIDGPEPKEDLMGTLLFIVGVYNLATLYYVEQRERVRRTIVNVQMQRQCSVPFRKVDFVKNRYWFDDRNFKRAIAIIDMFLARFPCHEMAGARECTISSRYKECGAVTDVQHLLETLDIDLDQAKGWIWTYWVACELKLVYKPGQEMDQPNSYAPYMIDIGLVSESQSPYSVKRNIGLHQFVHVIAATLGSNRSRNAYIGDSPPIPEVLLNAKIVAYVYWRQRQQNRSESGERQEPETQDPKQWLAWFKGSKHNGDWLEVVNRALQDVWGKFRNTRPKTVGQYLYDMASGGHMSTPSCNMELKNFNALLHDCMELFSKISLQ